MPVAGVMLECAACGMRWTVAPRPDGTMPAGARCPRNRGGCGKVRKLPRRAAVTAPAAAVAAAGAWDPPSVPRPARDADVPCPQCGGTVRIEPRGITRWCPACDMIVTPPGVLAPYERGAGSTRQARTQRERDDDAKKTVLVAGEFLRRVRALAGDPKIHPASADLLGWYDEEITEARRDRDGGRLAELAGEFAADRQAGAFRRLHWWQGPPAAISAADDDDGYGDDRDDEDDDDDGRPGPAPVTVLATPASIAAQQQRAQPQRMTWAGAAAALGWQMAAGGGGCGVIADGRQCGAPDVRHIGRFPSGDVFACQRHCDVMALVITRHNQRISA